MPIVAQHLQKLFKLNTSEGLPESAVTIKGTEHWVMCCPLCGCTHQLNVVDESQPYVPLCQTLPLVFKAQRVVWHKLHPEVAAFTRLHLVSAV